MDYGAILALKLAHCPRANQILGEVAARNPQRGPLVARALEYVRSNSPPLTDPDLEALAARVAPLVQIGVHQGNRRPVYNRSGDKALVDMIFQAGDDRLTYTATFHRVSGIWNLRGVRETLQELMMTMVGRVPQRQSALRMLEETPPAIAPAPPPAIPSLLDASRISRQQ